VHPGAKETATQLVQVAQRAVDLDRAAKFYSRLTCEELRMQGVEIVSEPHVIFTHEDGALGPAGTDEWMAFFTDSEGNTVGLVSHEPPEG